MGLPTRAKTCTSACWPNSDTLSHNQETTTSKRRIHKCSFFSTHFYHKSRSYCRRVLETQAIVVRHVWLAATNAGVLMRTCGRDAPFSFKVPAKPCASTRGIGPSREQFTVNAVLLDDLGKCLDGVRTCGIGAFALAFPCLLSAAKSKGS